MQSKDGKLKWWLLIIINVLMRGESTKEYVSEIPQVYIFSLYDSGLLDFVAIS